MKELFVQACSRHRIPSMKQSVKYKIQMLAPFIREILHFFQQEGIIFLFLNG